MIASKRERIIGLLTAGVLAALALDWLVLTPLTDRGRQAAAEVEAARAELDLADVLFANGDRLNRRWTTMLAAGIKADVPQAESQALNALRDWAQDAGVSLASLKGERVENGEHFGVVLLRATCTGSLRSISQLLWRVQTADIPLRVTDLQLVTRKEGTDDLTLQLGVSTLCLAAPTDPLKPPGGGRARPVGPLASAAGAANDRREATR